MRAPYPPCPRLPVAARRGGAAALLALALLLVAPGSTSAGEPAMLSKYLDAIRFYPSNNVYPYEAVGNRKAAIEAGRESLALGMDVEAVRGIMGPPERIKPLYAVKKAGRPPVGFTYWYFTRRLAPKGSQKERGERYVRITFNLEGRLRQVDVHEVPGFLEVWPLPSYQSCEEAKAAAAKHLALGRPRLMIVGPKRYGGANVQRFRRFLMRKHKVQLLIHGCELGPGDDCYRKAMDAALKERFGDGFLGKLEAEAGVRPGE